MMLLRQLLFILLLMMLACTHLHATIIHGRVTDSKNAPLPFASVFVQGTTNGTTTNTEGYYKLDLKPGSYTIVFKYIGYRQVEKKIDLSAEKIELNVILEEEDYLLSEAVVKAGDKDPAYEIMRLAIAKRKFYRSQVEEYSCDVYVKGIQRITKYPKKILGQKVDLSQILDSTTGVVYLSESVSEFHFSQPDNVKEIMVSSKVSGGDNTFSFNRASDFVFNFYDNIVGKGGLSARGFISPVAGNAMFYYKFKLAGTFTEGSITVNKIEVIPKRQHDPVFRGFIFIQDSSWRIHSTDLYLCRDAQLEFVDTIRIHQVMLPVENNEHVWLTVSNKFTFSYKAFGFEGDGVYMGVMSNYNITPQFAKKFFDGEVIKIQEGSNKRDSTYWESIRPVPLTEMEKNDYQKKDSLRVIYESKPYMDSVDRKNNKPTVGSILLSGYTYNMSYKKSSLSFKSLIESINFNTVEGLNIGNGATYIKRYDKRKRLQLGADLRYAFSEKDLFGTATIDYRYNIFKSAAVIVTGGHDAVQYNENKPITPFLNTWYTLTAKLNYMKIYEKDFLKITYRRELTNGIMLWAITEYADREALINTTDYTWKKNTDRVYTSNDPENRVQKNEVPAFDRHQSWHANVILRFRIKQKYYNDPETHYLLGSDYPTFFLRYKKGLALAGSDVDYDAFSAGFEDQFGFGMLGALDYSFTYGRFLSDKKMYFIDYKHFNGNLTFLSEFRLNDFQQLDYYKYSTNNSWIEAHASHNFKGFFLNKIPGLRKLLLSEVVSAHYVHTNDLDHFEFGIGIEKFSVLRIDFVSAVAKHAKPITGIRIGTRVTNLID